MPLYEYQCRECGETTEVIQKFSDLPLSTCKFCGGALERLISAPAIQFKGSGWYITDYARNGRGAAGGSSDKTSSEAPASSSASDSTQQETKKTSE